jgi:hypothetical protein
MLESLHRNRPAARCLPLSSQLVLALIRGDGKKIKRSCPVPYYDVAVRIRMRLYSTMVTVLDGF